MSILSAKKPQEYQTDDGNLTIQVELDHVYIFAPLGYDYGELSDLAEIERLRDDLTGLLERVKT